MPYAPVEAYAGVGLGEETLAEIEASLDGTLTTETLEALLGTDSLRWTLSLWPGVDTSAEPPARLDVIDALDGGMWLIDEPEEGAPSDSVLLRPMQAEAAWFFLSTALQAASGEGVAGL